MRKEVDDRGVAGQFILTGSSVPDDDVTRHSGAGRIARLRMRPMSLSESGHSSGEVSLAALFESTRVQASAPGLTVLEVIDRICIGGWPALQDMAPPDAGRLLRSYIADVARTDLSRVDSVRRDPDRVLRLLRSLARNTATQVTATRLAADAGGGGSPLSDDTVRDYLSALERLMVLENQPAWSPSMRSRSALRVSDKRHFVDPSLAVAALGGSPQKLLADLNLLGFLFESLVVRDLRIHAQTLGGQVLHFRDNKGLEADAIVALDDGRGALWRSSSATPSCPMLDRSRKPRGTRRSCCC